MFDSTLIPALAFLSASSLIYPETSWRVIEMTLKKIKIISSSLRIADTDNDIKIVSRVEEGERVDAPRRWDITH